MKQTFYSNGKLFITGEYVVLDGAKAFALPTKFGQDLVVWDGDGKMIRWKSFDADGSVWFESEIAFVEIIGKQTGDDPIKNTLVEILHAAYLMRPNWVSADGYTVTTHLTFPRIWGLGTSSTLVNNVAQWLSIDAYQLLWNSFGGSGYDIACAQHNQPVVFTAINKHPKVTLVDFKPPFADQLYFVYLNQKQSSKTAIAAYKSKKGNIQATVDAIDTITDQILKTQDSEMFADLLQQHENILSPILEIPTAKQHLFADFDGTVKSLGAWGGDFVLVVSQSDPSSYFRSKGYETIIRYPDMIL